MAYHLETVEGAHAVVNFVPTLLDEIEWYDLELIDYLKQGTPLSDPLLGYLADTRPLPNEEEPRCQLVKACLRAQEQQMIASHAPYQSLAETGRGVVEGKVSACYLSDSYLYDLLVWHHISWLGESIRQTSEASDRLYQKSSFYTADDRRALLELIQQTLHDLIPRYRKLHQQGVIELALSPYAHPIIPLLIDHKVATESLPGAPLPTTQYPSGEERARWHFKHGIERFQHHFGVLPKGLWPSEGAVSSDTLRMAEEFGFRWCATGEQVWRNTLNSNQLSAERAPGAPLKLDNTDLYCFARCDGISDRIGFVYAPWHSDDALHDLINHILAIRDSDDWHPDQLLSIIMDGENAWEHYPQNGWHFLRTLYQKLAEHPEIELTTFCKALDTGTSEQAIEVEKVTAGSWVHGTLATWIGNHEKNLAWDLLCDAANAVQPHLNDPQRHPLLDDQLAICESSDWFWWLGENPPSIAANEFDLLYRTHLQNLYQMAGLAIPDSLYQQIDPRAGEAGGTGTMKLANG